MNQLLKFINVFSLVLKGYDLFNKVILKKQPKENIKLTRTDKLIDAMDKAISIREQILEK